MVTVLVMRTGSCAASGILAAAKTFVLVGAGALVPAGSAARRQRAAPASAVRIIFFMSGNDVQMLAENPSRCKWFIWPPAGTLLFSKKGWELMGNLGKSWEWLGNDGIAAGRGGRRRIPSTGFCWYIAGFSWSLLPPPAGRRWAGSRCGPVCLRSRHFVAWPDPVSYTHLTLPTIYSV